MDLIAGLPDLPQCDDVDALRSKFSPPEQARGADTKTPRAPIPEPANGVDTEVPAKVDPYQARS